MTSPEEGQSITMERLLKEAMLLHKNTVKELSETRDRCEKAQLARKSILDKAKGIQRDCQLLRQENKHLKEVKETLQGRSEDNVCKTCHYLQQSMDTLKDAFTRTIEEKDRAIRILEERLAEKSQARDKLESGGDGMKSSGSAGRCGGNGANSTSPDTTSGRGERAGVSRDVDSGHSVSKVGEEVSPGSRRSVLTLPKDRQRRSRYEEAPVSSVTMATRRQSQNREASQITGADNSIGTNPKEKRNGLKMKDTFLSEVMRESPQKSAKRPRGSEDDGKCVNSPGGNSPIPKLLKKDSERPNIVVPETMAVDYFDEVDGDDSDCSEHETEILKRQDLHGVDTVSNKACDNSEQFSIGPPNACSTQIYSKLAAAKSLCVSSAKQDTIDESADLDNTVIRKSQSDPKSQKLSLDVTKKCRNDSHYDGDEFPLSPVFVGVKKTDVRPSDIKSPSLFDDDNKMVAHDESYNDDSESPFLLRQPVMLGQRSNMPEVISDGESQSPSLLHRHGSKSHGASQDQSDSLKHFKGRDSNQSGSLSQQSLRKSTHSKSSLKSSAKSAGDFKQTTLTQTFDWSSSKTTKSPENLDDTKCPSLQEIQNIESRLSPRSLARQNKLSGCTGNTGEVENCIPRPEFKKPVSPSGKISKARSPPKQKSLATSAHSKKPAAFISKQRVDFDPDETVPPEALQMSSQEPHKGDNCSQSQYRLPASRFVGDQNASLDPAVQLSLDYPDTVAPTADPGRSPHTTRKHKINSNKTNNDKIMEEQSQHLPSSSKSFKFVPGRPTPKLPSDEALEGALSDEGSEDGTCVDQGQLEGHKGAVKLNGSLNCSYDRVPKKKSPGFAYVDVVRKKDERQKLKAYFCQECEDYFKDVGLSEEERAERMQRCSRHRARYVPPSTPEHFWSIGFPDTPECEERGYIRKASPQGPSRFRRKKRLEKRFKGKTEEEAVESKVEEPLDEADTSDLIFDL